ncbi:hypothetical protein [Euzebya sp.]|uniref:hypothetical protein n=1 Tax=Euzebya sp. TaxID=1971409 RepID=UPI0035146302
MRDDRARDVYAGARSEELAEPLLPRWFVLLALTAVPVALGVAVWAFGVFGPHDGPGAERRPPPAGDLATDVGQFNVGTSAPEPLTLEGCARYRGIQGAGSDADVARIDAAVSALCEVTVPEAVARRLQAFAAADGVIRFAQFQATGVDSTLDVSTDPPRVLLNARFARDDTESWWIAPLVAHDTTFLELDPTLAASALEAREAEAVICDRLEEDDRPSRACEDARALVDLLDPIRALEAAGFE